MGRCNIPHNSYNDNREVHLKNKTLYSITNYPKWGVYFNLFDYIYSLYENFHNTDESRFGVQELQKEM